MRGSRVRTAGFMRVQRGGARTVARGQVERDADRLVQLQQLRVVPAGHSAMRRQRDGGRAKVRRLRRGARTMAPRSGAECRRRAACRHAPAAARPSACPARRRKTKILGQRLAGAGGTVGARTMPRLGADSYSSTSAGGAAAAPASRVSIHDAAKPASPLPTTATRIGPTGGGRHHGAVLLAQRHRVQG